MSRSHLRYGEDVGQIGAVSAALNTFAERSDAREVERKRGFRNFILSAISRDCDTGLNSLRRYSSWNHIGNQRETLSTIRCDFLLAYGSGEPE